MNLRKPSTATSILSILLAVVLAIGLCPGFGVTLARADEGGQTPPAAPEGARVVAADGTTTNPDGSAGDPVDAIDVYRFYNPYTGEHLFTQDDREIESLLETGWVDEDIEWLAPEVSAMPMWRLYNPYTYEHLYTMDENEYTTLSSVGWNGEGIFSYSAASDGMPVYRLYNPYGDGISAHHYTTDPAERGELLNAGWKSDGVTASGASCYGLTVDPIDDHEVDLNDNVKTLAQDHWSLVSVGGEEAAIANDADGAATAASIPNTGATGQEITISVSKAQGADLHPGDVIAGFPGETGAYGASMVIKSVEPADDGYLVTGTVPKLSDLVDSVDVSGVGENADATIDFAPGVTPVPTASNDPDAIGMALDLEEMGLADAIAPASEHRVTIDEGIDLVVTPNIKYDFKFSWLQVRKAEFVVVLDTTLELASYKATKEFEKELFTYSFPVPYTLGAVVVNASFSIVANATGTISLGVHSHVEEGFDYDNGKFQWVSDTPIPSLQARFDGTVRAGILPDATLTVLGLNTIYLGVEGGVGVSGHIVVAADAGASCNVNAYPYITLHLNKKWNVVGELLDALSVPTSFELMNERNAPKWSWELAYDPFADFDPGDSGAYEPGKLPSIIPTPTPPAYDPDKDGPLPDDESLSIAA